MRYITQLLVIFTLLVFVASCSDLIFDPGELDRSTLSASKTAQQDAPPASPMMVDVSTAKRAAALPTGPMKPAAPGPLVVDDDLVECPGAAYTTIQAAVDDAALMPGKDKIEVCTGTYAEDVAVGAGNDLDIKGDGVGLTTVTGAAASGAPIFLITGGSKVKIEKLTVDGLSARTGGVAYGIRYEDSDGEVKKAEVLNIRNASGSTQGIGVAFLAMAGTSKGKVEKTRVANYTRVGIFANGTGADVKVKDNTISGPVLPRVHAPNGIQISRGAKGKVEKNEVDNNPSPNPPGGAGSGILLFCADKTDIKGNTITDADLGIGIADNQDAKIEKNDITDSVFDGISLQFIGFFFGGDIGCGITPVEDNKVKDNKIDGSADTGISFANFDPANAPATPNDNKIEKNDVKDSGVDGISLFDGTANDLKKNKVKDSGDVGIRTSAGTSGNVFDANDVKGSGTLSCEDTSVGGGTAGTDNTWKKNKGQAPSSPVGICK